MKSALPRCRLPPGRNALSKQRFSTWFFVAPADDGQDDEWVTADGSEVIAHRWVAPAVALGMQERHEILLVPPTYVTLSQLGRYGDVASALAAADPRYFATEIRLVGDTRVCLWAGDAAYGGGQLATDGPRHRLLMDEANGWRYFNTVG